MARNYRKEYDNYQGKSKQKKNRAMRNKVRRRALREGQVTKGSGKDIHHKDGKPMNTSRSNTSVKSVGKNRSFPRNKRAGKK